MTIKRPDPEDGDLLDGAVPAPDAASTGSEAAHAHRFGELIDKALTGRAPAAMTADDRALLEVATVIRAASGGGGLAATRQRALVEEALRQGVGEAAPSERSRAPIVALPRTRRWAPWVIAGGSAVVAAAALLLLWLRPPARREVAPTARIETPTQWRSRPTDALVGEIKREHAGDARARIDVIFADRLDGYRERRWARSAAPSPNHPGHAEGAPR
jgi:hypothetical protein